MHSACESWFFNDIDERISWEDPSLLHQLKYKPNQLKMHLIFRIFSISDTTRLNINQTTTIVPHILFIFYSRNWRLIWIWYSLKKISNVRINYWHLSLLNLEIWITLSSITHHHQNKFLSPRHQVMIPTDQYSKYSPTLTWLCDILQSRTIFIVKQLKYLRLTK